MQIKQSFWTGFLFGLGLFSLIASVVTFITTGRMVGSSLGVIIALIFVWIGIAAKKKTS